MNKKVIAALTVSALLGIGTIELSNQATDAATTMRIVRSSYVYNKKGKRVKKFSRLYAGTRLTVYNTKRIHGIKYYRIGKNIYIRVNGDKKLKIEKQLSA